MKLSKLTFNALASMLLLATTFRLYYRNDSVNITQRFLMAKQNSEADYEMFVTVLLNGDNTRLIFGSFFFKAALEQSLKDFMNGNPLCNDGQKKDSQLPSYSSFDLDLSRASQDELLGTVELDIDSCKPDSYDGNDLQCYVVVKAKCRGQREKCTERVNEKFQDTGKTQQTKKKGSQKSVCEFDIYDLLNAKYTSPSIFFYHVIESEQKFSFGFQQSPDNSLSDVDDVKARDNVAEVDKPTCSQYCQEQPEILREFYDNLGMEFHYEEHECEHVGINCDHEKKATQIWLNDKKISNALDFSKIHLLREMRGLFLENNEIEGTIPDMSRLVQRLKRLESLRLENNKLKGSLPSTLGNLAGLREFIATNNTISNEIPLSLLYNNKLKTLDLGNNLLNGTIPIPKKRINDIPDKGCAMSRNVFAKLRSRMPEEIHAEASESSLETLSLYNNRLNGQVPSSLFELPKLHILNLANNRLTGTLPTEVGLAKELKVLDIRGGLIERIETNQLGGEIPSEIGEASRLEILNLFNNRLRGTIPSEIMKLKELSELVLDENRLTGPISDFHPNKTLKIISLGMNEFSSTIPVSVSYLRNTAVLNLMFNELTGSIPSEIGNMKSLEYLTLSWNNLNGTLPSELGNLSSLRRLDLDLNDLRGTLPTELGLLANVELIYLFINNLSGSIPSELGLLTNLRSIYLADNNLSGPVPSELFALPNLWFQGIQIRPSWAPGGNPNLYALCDEYFDPDKIDIPCGTLFPSSTPSVSLRPTLSPPPSTTPSTPPSCNPTSSSVPTLFPDCSCEPGEFKFELELKTDFYPNETSWQIQDVNGGIFAQNPEYSEHFEIFIHDYCLPAGCYNFVIYDSFGDGLCCGYYNDDFFLDYFGVEDIDDFDGYYKGSVYGWKEVFDGGEFVFQAIENFCGEDLCPFATHYPSTSPSTTSRPSITISTSPSLIPTSSSKPTFRDYSCGVGEFKFQLELKTDGRPQETSWQILDENGDIRYTNETAYNWNDSLTTFNDEYCLPVGCYVFIIDDSYGDGICCISDTVDDFHLDSFRVEGIDDLDGYYRGSIYGWKEIFNGGEFGSQAIENFCGEDVCM